MNSPKASSPGNSAGSFVEPAGRNLQVRKATTTDRDWIHDLRHRVFAEELGQHSSNRSGRLRDNLDGHNVYLVVASGEDRAGFISVTPPWVGRYSLDKYVTRTDFPLLDDEPVFEVRILTVEPRWRHSGVAMLLMYAAMRWVTSRGGRTIVAMCREDLIEMYRAVGFAPAGHTIRSGAVKFEVMTASIRRATALASGSYAEVVDRWRTEVDWQLDVALSTGPDGCEHGGASFAAIGPDFRTLDQRPEIIAADVLDAWFPPAPGVAAALRRDTDWLTRTSPPTDAGGLLTEIAIARDLPADALAVGAGSSDLIFRTFTSWLTPRSRVLLVDPSYGEYAHVTERVIGCEVDRLRIRRDDGWRIDPARLAQAVSAHEYDLVVLVNPNNPTGRHLPAAQLQAIIGDAPAGTRWWIDEAYIGYVDFAESLADLAACDTRVVVCTSLSKMYALSGMRAAFLVAAPAVAADMRLRTPPWQVSLPAQVAAVTALRDPTYYRSCWECTHDLRHALAASLGLLDGVVVEEAVANFVTLTLPVHGPSSAEFVAECRQHGVFLRDLSPMSPEYEGRTVRIAVRDTAENERIIDACTVALNTLRRPGGSSTAVPTR